jgi:hypothetical protein
MSFGAARILTPIVDRCVNGADPAASSKCPTTTGLFSRESRGTRASGWTAYVSIGSVARGREIVTTGGVMRSVVPNANLTKQDMAGDGGLPRVVAGKTSRPLTHPSGNATR